MAHYLPRKKYLSKLLHDSPEDKKTSVAAADVDSSMTLSCDKLAANELTESSSCDQMSANESAESLLMAIANSTTLGISSDFGSAVFTIDTNGNCSLAGGTTELTSSGESANCRDGPSSSVSTEKEQHGGSNDDERAADSPESSPVYFDDGSMDDDVNDDDNGVKMEDEDVVVGSSSAVSGQSLVSADVIPLTSSSDQLTLPGSSSADQLTLAGAGGSLTLPSSVSMSNLIDDDVLNTLMPSAESFANLLSSLETKDVDRKSGDTNRRSRDMDWRSHDSEMKDSNRPQTMVLTVNHDQSVPNNVGGQLNPRMVSNTADQLNISLQQQQQQSELSLSSSSLSALSFPMRVIAEATAAAASHTKLATSSSSSYDPLHQVYVKEEQIDSSYDQQLSSWLTEQQSSLVTTSGRNRGRGKASEPKYDCQICGDVAAGYHCGAYVCEACKKFYLRCLKMGASPAFLCPKDNACEITKDTRSQCQFCRFKKCLHLGMYRPGCEDDKKLKVDFKSIACKVCNAPSSGFHFGAITCEGCKGFFRRMLKEQLHKKFICTNGENCEIASANRTNCKFCRFAKCLRVGMTLEGTRLGRQSNSAKLSTLMQYQCNATTASSNNNNSSSSNRASQLHAEINVDHHGDGAADDQSAVRNVSSSPLATRSNSNAANLCNIWRESQRRRSETDMDQRSVVTEMRSGDVDRRSHDFAKLCEMKQRSFETTERSRDMDWQSRDTGRSQDMKMRSSDTDRRSRDMDWGSHSQQLAVAMSSVSDQHCTMDNSAISISMSSASDNVDSNDTASAAGRDYGQHLRTISQTVCSSVDLPCGTIDSALSLGDATSSRTTHSELNQAGSVEYSSIGPDDVSKSQCSELELDLKSVTGQNERNQSSALAASQFVESSCEVDQFKSQSPIESSGEVTESSGEMPRCYRHVDRDSLDADCHVEHADQMDVEHCGDCDQLLLHDPIVMLRFMAEAFRELDEIMNRPAELDAVKSSPASMETLWKLVEIPFMHQAKCVLRFIKKLPGFRKLPVELQIKLAQNSVYPVTLIFHSKYYNLATGEYNWFINTPAERDLVLGILPPFAALGSHFSSTGFTLKTLALSDEEMAFLAAMAVLSATDGSCVQSSCDVVSLQDSYIDAFISYCQGSGRVNRMSVLIARLPELKRANIEHCLIAAQVQQMSVAQVEMGMLWRELFLAAGHQTPDHI